MDFINKPDGKNLLNSPIIKLLLRLAKFNLPALDEYFRWISISQIVLYFCLESGFFDPKNRGTF